MAGSACSRPPDVFDQRDEDGVAVLLVEDPPVELHDGIREAARLCPAVAIELAERAET